MTYTVANLDIKCVSSDTRINIIDTTMVATDTISNASNPSLLGHEESVGGTLTAGGYGRILLPQNAVANSYQYESKMSEMITLTRYHVIASSYLHTSFIRPTTSTIYYTILIVAFIVLKLIPSNVKSQKLHSISFILCKNV